jgi:hypothetical protein
MVLGARMQWAMEAPLNDRDLDRPERRSERQPLSRNELSLQEHPLLATLLQLAATHLADQ